MALPIQKNRNGVGSNLHGVRIQQLSIDGDAISVASAFHLHNARARAARTLELYFEFHGVRFSCSRRPSDFQREVSLCGPGFVLPEESACMLCQTAAAIATASSVPGRIATAVACGLANNSSSHLV